MKQKISIEAKNSVLVLLLELVNIKDAKLVHLNEAHKRIISRIEADLFGNGVIYTVESIEETGNKLLVEEICECGCEGQNKEYPTLSVWDKKCIYHIDNIK